MVDLLVPFDGWKVHQINFVDTIESIFGMERGYDTIREILRR